MVTSAIGSASPNISIWTGHEQASFSLPDVRHDGHDFLPANAGHPDRQWLRAVIYDDPLKFTWLQNANLASNILEADIDQILDGFGT